MQPQHPKNPIGEIASKSTQDLIREIFQGADMEGLIEIIWKRVEAEFPSHGLTKDDLGGELTSLQATASDAQAFKIALAKFKERAKPAHRSFMNYAFEYISQIDRLTEQVETKLREIAELEMRHRALQDRIAELERQKANGYSD